MHRFSVKSESDIQALLSVSGSGDKLILSRSPSSNLGMEREREEAWHQWRGYLLKVLAMLKS